MQVSITSKPRGIVDLSKVTDVSDAREQTGKNNSLKLSTAQGHVCYVADSETELVEWMSALEGAVAKIMKAIAGACGACSPPLGRRPEHPHAALRNPSLLDRLSAPAARRCGGPSAAAQAAGGACSRQRQRLEPGAGAGIPRSQRLCRAPAPQQRQRQRQAQRGRFLGAQQAGRLAQAQQGLRGPHRHP